MELLLYACITVLHKYMKVLGNDGLNMSATGMCEAIYIRNCITTLFIQPMERCIMIMFRFVEPNSSNMKTYDDFLMSNPMSK
jgi:hypothetical protein